MSATTCQEGEYRTKNAPGNGKKATGKETKLKAAKTKDAKGVEVREISEFVPQYDGLNALTSITDILSFSQLLQADATLVRGFLKELFSE